MFPAEAFKSLNSCVRIGLSPIAKQVGHVNDNKLELEYVQNGRRR